MQDPDLAAGELERCVRELGLRGAEIGTHVDRESIIAGRIDTLNLDNASLDRVWSTAEQLNAAIFVHPWDMLGKERMPKYWLPWLVGMPAETSLAICSMIFGGVFERFPKLARRFRPWRRRISVYHWSRRARVSRAAGPGRDGKQHKSPRISCVAATRPRGSMSIRSSTTPTHWRLLLKLFGAQRVALGSDYPFPLGEAKPGQLIESMKLSAEEKAQLLSGTAREFLGL